MAYYEVVRYIQNECERNQMRDVIISEIETDDPEGYIRNLLKSTKDLQITSLHSEKGEMEFDVAADGLHEKFSFSEL